MKKISWYVEDHMRKAPYISKFLRLGILNYKAMARYIEPDISKEIGEKVSVGAIAVALQRLHHRDKDKIYNLIGRLKGVKVISNVSTFVVHDKSTAYRAIAELYTEGTLERPFVKVLEGDEETLLAAEKFAAMSFNEPDFQKTADKLTGLVIYREVYKDSGKEVGGLNYPLQVLAEHGILVRAVSATFTEEVILVDEAVADQAASILRHAMWR